MPKRKSPDKKFSTEIWVALIGVIGTLIAAIIPLFFKSTPTEELLQMSPADLKPQPFYPANKTTLSQNYKRQWDFKWHEPKITAGIKQYNLVIFGSNATYPLVDIYTKTNSYQMSVKKCSYVSDYHRLGWRWKVRAQYKDGLWSEWSEEFVFDIDAFSIIEFCDGCPSSDSCSSSP